MIELIYKEMCPNCGGDIESARLAKGLVCKKCLPEEVEPEKLCEELREGEYLRVCELSRKYVAFEEFFQAKIGFPLRSLQQMWAKRFFLGRSFALLAPTGIGKSTFGLTLAAFLQGKSYLIFPTQLLAIEATKRLEALGARPLLYNSSLPAKKKQEIKDKIAAGDFSILVTTTGFLYKNFSIIPTQFDFIFVDDVDSVLKSAKNIDKLLQVAGFSPEDIQEALEFIDLKIKMLRSKKFDQTLFESKRQRVEKIAAKPHATLIVSSATANPRSRRVLLFRELLGFEVARPKITLRNIEDLYEEPKDMYAKSVERIKEFGKGGLVFLPGNETKEKLTRFVEFLQNSGIKAISYEELKKDEEPFRSGAVDVVVGFASYRNPLARGIDMPATIRYALFVGVPKMEFRLDLERHSSLYFFLLALLPALKEEQAYQEVLGWIGYLAKVYKIPKERLTPQAKQRIEEIAKKVQDILSDELIQRINASPDVSIKKEEHFRIVTADVTGYLQASGRTSRLYAGGLTKGLALVLVDDKKAFWSLQKKVRWFSDEIVFKPADEVDIPKILHQIDEDRALVKKALEGKLPSANDFFTTTLVIVESPNKARTIANFYGKPIVRNLHSVVIYEVAKEGRLLQIAASKGHIFDLDKEEGFFGVQVSKQYVPLFEPIDENKEVIMEVLRQTDLEVQEIFVATDPDVEGEKIAYDIYLNSKPFNSTIQRAEFHEVTKRAFDEALKKPRAFNEDLVKAQLVRRVADRWIGFEISGYLQKKFGKKWLSAGRVQSAVLEWIVQRELEAKRIVYVVRAAFGGFYADFVFEKSDEAKRFYEALESVVIRFEKTKEVALFREPFTTDAMLFEASNHLHFSPQKTMQLAQDLFEAGFITYHRTDSKRVSPVGIALAKEYIANHFGKEYFVARSYEKSGGAHECIRPTKGMDSKDLEEFLRLSGKSLTKEHLKLYDLVFRNFIASQMKEAVVKEIEATIEALGQSTHISVYSEIIQRGIDLVWNVELHPLQEGEVRVQKSAFSKSKVGRYTYAQIIRMMKEKGVGRPSTYAITIQKLEERRYIFQKNGVLFATKLGVQVYEELRSNEDIYYFVNEHYTKELEALMDAVERHQADYQEILKNIYISIKGKLHENTL